MATSKRTQVSDHTMAFVPLGSGYVQSIDLFARQRPVDTGLLAEALIYYDRILINVDNPVQFSQLISWLIQQGLPVPDITSLFQEGVLQVYDFSFTTNPFVEFYGEHVRINGLMHFEDQIMKESNSFFKRFVDFEPLRQCFADHQQYEHFATSLEGRVIEVKANEVGAGPIDNAYRDFLTPDRSALMAQELVDEIYRIKSLGKPPDIKVGVRDVGGGKFEISWNVPLNRLPAVEVNSNIRAAVTLPLSTAAQANKYLWASEKEKCDLYLARPVSMLVGDKLFEVGETATKDIIKTYNLIEELQIKVEFPDVRRLVNLDKIDFNHVLQIRKKAKRFRHWLQSEADRDRDAIIAYHHEVANESGFAKVGRTTLKLFGVLGGASIGATVTANPAVGAALGAAGGAAVGALVDEGVKYVSDLSASVGTGWKPVVFGDWYSTKIAKLLKEGSEGGV